MARPPSFRRIFKSTIQDAVSILGEFDVSITVYLDDKRNRVVLETKSLDPLALESVDGYWHAGDPRSPEDPMYNLGIRFNADGDLTALIFASIVSSMFWAIADELDNVRHIWTDQFIFNPAKKMCAELIESEDPFVSQLASGVLEGYEESRAEYYAGRD